MGRELQKKKKRSSISKIKMKPKSKRVNPLGNPIIAANCKSSTTSKLSISNAIPKQFAPTSARIERDPETGKILRVIHDGKKANPLHDPLNDIEDAEMADDGEEFGGFDEGTGGKKKKQATNDIVRRLEAQAAMVGEKRDRTQSEREREWIERLVLAHGENFERMARDRRLNPMQQTPNDLRRRVGKWKATQGKSVALEA
ncbi:putative Nucleolar protein 16 [Diplocarpon rosae]|nr:putative Nucleolar protein 16 [Diplocarpon rosae]